MMRIMAPEPGWAESPAERDRARRRRRCVMGAYYPKGEYTTKEAFEALGGQP